MTTLQIWTFALTGVLCLLILFLAWAFKDRE